MKLLDIFMSNDSEKLLKLLPVLFSTILQCKQIMPERQDLQPLTPSKATTLCLTTFWLGPLSQALSCLIFQQKPTKSWSGVVQASWGIFRKRFNQETRWSVSFTATFPHLVLGGYKMKKISHINIYSTSSNNGDPLNCLKQSINHNDTGTTAFNVNLRQDSFPQSQLSIRRVGWCYCSQPSSKPNGQNGL